jgi:hypothetical protein
MLLVNALKRTLCDETPMGKSYIQYNHATGSGCKSRQVANFWPCIWPAQSSRSVIVIVSLPPPHT